MGIDAAGYRGIMGHFATGVTVVTTAVDGWLHGMTANALTSVSLEPLLLLVCVGKQAQAHAQLSTGGRFVVNILTAEQEEVSRTFAVSSGPERHNLRGVPYRLRSNGLPVLEGCLAYLECAVADRWAGGDHTIFIGEVLEGEVLLEAAPLLFYRGGYRGLES